MSKVVLIYSTWPGSEAAEAAGAALVRERLAACVNILPGMLSIYEWEGAIARDREAVMIVKTTAAKAEAAIAAARALHTYDIPAFVTIETVGGLPAYLAWVADQAGGVRPPPA